MRSRKYKTAQKISNWLNSPPQAHLHHALYMPSSCLPIQHVHVLDVILNVILSLFVLRDDLELAPREALLDLHAQRHAQPARPRLLHRGPHASAQRLGAARLDLEDQLIVYLHR